MNCKKTGIVIVAVVLLLVAVSGCNGTSPSPTPSSSPNPSTSTAGPTVSITASPTPSPSTSPAFSITSPLNGATVSRSITAQGIGRGLADGQTLWLVIVPKSLTPARYYPADAPINVQPDGTWLQAVFIGSDSPNDVGQKFDIMLVSANQNANSTFATYIATCKSSGNCPGMLSLPQGATVQSTVTVTRM